MTLYSFSFADFPFVIATSAAQGALLTETELARHHATARRRRAGAASRAPVSRGP